MTKKGKKTVLISGCSSGIGRDLAVEFAASGYHVFATARKPQAIRDLVGANIDVLQLDVTKGASIRKCVSDAIKKSGRIDVLVNNAGYGLMGPVIDITHEDMIQQFDTNYFGALALIKEVAPSMMRNKSGRIINISSVSGVFPTPFAGIYCSTKAALNAVSDSLRMELAPFGIEVILVLPGYIRTNFGNRAFSTLKKNKKSFYYGFREFIEARANESQNNASSSMDLAATIVKAVSGKKAPRVLKVGRRSVFIPMLAKLPRFFTDRILRKKFGLN